MKTENDKICAVQEIMRFYDIKCWIMHCDEHSDPYFSKIISANTIVPSIAILSQRQCNIIVHELDADNITKSDKMIVLSYKKEKELWEKIEKIIIELDFPKSIALNYSTFLDAQVDVIGHGLYEHITNELTNVYETNEKKVNFSSAEEIIYAFSDRKGEEDISKMRVAARRALEILEAAFNKIEPGMTELDVVKLVHLITDEKPDYFSEFGVVEEAYSWREDLCPVVLAGPSLQKGGHALASDLKIEKGFTIYFDFGVQLTFEDGTKWSSDIQRMGYLLKNGEQKAPPEVHKMFSTLVEAIELGMEFIRPGMKGYEVDEVVRGHILKNGYPDYNHATGHSIGEEAHNPGALLGPKGRNLSKLKVQPSGVYSIEPRISINNGGSIEETVLVTEKGGVPLCEPQKQIYLIG